MAARKRLEYIIFHSNTFKLASENVISELTKPSSHLSALMDAEMLDERRYCQKQLRLKAPDVALLAPAWPICHQNIAARAARHRAEGRAVSISCAWRHRAY